ncbi:MAG: aminotransferase class V-fold PLP-dependent enzyme [Lachnospiraceae bacterium]|nr:aminotransferase class V-fold PLP-dependent enzyme [Lachnospiraceae bacterium]
MCNQDKTPLLDAITEFIDTKPAYFRIPGHRLERGISKKWTDKVGKEIFAYDVTETPFTDDLHSPEGAIEEAQELLQELYGAERSFFLVNGTTCGNEAMLLSVALEGQEVMVARNAHKSAMMGLIISGAKPVYIMPEILSEWGLQGGITPEQVRRTFEAHPACRALFLVSPSYYGIVSDLKAIADICHEYGAMLLIDEAHGGHLYFHEDLPKGALEQGADMCVQSMHKVTGALTQSSVLHMKSQLVDVERLAANLHIVQSTSPNYLLMTSLDCARYELALHGTEMMEQALRLAEDARKRIQAIDGFRCMGQEVVGQAGIAGVDGTRLIISAKEFGLTGFALEEILFERYAVNMELADYENVLAIVTYANTQEELERLVKACEEIAQEYSRMQETACEQPQLPQLPEQMLTPRQAYFAEAEEIAWQQAVGRISAEMIAPYPPGIPIIYPGECITQAVWDYLEKFRREKRHIHGSRDGRLEVIKVIKEESE